MATPFLETPGPYPHHDEALSLYGQLVGSWQIEARLLQYNGAWQQSQGEWHFSWGLAGLAVIDVIHSPDRALLAQGKSIAEMGTTVRVPDPDTETWQITFVSAHRHHVQQLVGRRFGDDIHQDGVDPSGTPIRWNFTDITGSSFRWRGYRYRYEDESWHLNEEMSARRAQGAQY